MVYFVRSLAVFEKVDRNKFILIMPFASNKLVYSVISLLSLFALLCNNFQNKSVFLMQPLVLLLEERCCCLWVGYQWSVCEILNFLMRTHMRQNTYHTYASTHTCQCTQKYALVYTHKPARMYTHIHLRMYTQTRLYIHIYTYACTHKRAYIYTLTRTNTQVRSHPYIFTIKHNSFP